MSFWQEKVLKLHSDAGKNMFGQVWDISLEKDELIALYIHLNNRYDELSPLMQGVARKVENTIFSNFTISEIELFESNNKGEP